MFVKLTYAHTDEAQIVEAEGSVRCEVPSTTGLLSVKLSLEGCTGIEVVDAADTVGTAEPAPKKPAAKKAAKK